ncbi:hypothetical protein [Actinoplanes sp. NPDC049316]|uniref:hypothetical protein n=1 Tax=Actinoplanes sp. NPDC049316 TaxID=3154727 RepID=UPI00343BD1B6
MPFTAAAAAGGFGGHPATDRNPDATMPFNAGAGSDSTMPFNAGASSDSTMPFNAGAGSDSTMPFKAGAGSDSTMPFNAGAGSESTMPFNAGAGSDSTMPFAAHAAQQAATYGVGASGPARQPFGGAAAPAGTSSARPTTYGSGSGQGGAVPQQRGEGTVYCGLADYAPADMTMPVMMNPVENSGSLTGHILAQGWRDAPEAQRRSNVKVIVAMLIVLLLLVGVSLAFLFTVGDAFSNMIGGVFSK